MIDLDPIQARRAVESLRSGVPSAAAIRALGWPHERHDEMIRGLLERSASGSENNLGILVKGDFGAGKSHLLRHVESIALDANFAVSRVVISKETPLFQPDKVFAAAVREGTVPGRRGSIIHELVDGLDLRSSQASGLIEFGMRSPGLVGASIAIRERSAQLADDELLARIYDWWAGEKIQVSDVKRGLKQVGLAQAYDVKSVKVADLVPLRIALTSHLIRASGYSGWLILLDELELVGRYSRLQRARSYAQLASWFGEGQRLGTNIACVGTITPDFSLAVLDAGDGSMDDRDGVGSWLRARGKDGDTTLARDAEVGMALIDDAPSIMLSGPDDEVLRRTYERVAEVYTQAFNWTVPRSEPRVLAGTTPMRTYVKTWIFGWDLERLGVTSAPTFETETITSSYEEDTDLEKASETSGEDE